MTDLQHKINRGIIRAITAEWERPVLDYEPGQGATPDRITRYACEVTDGEYAYWCDRIDGQYDDETDLEWCGLGRSWVETHTLGDHIFDDRCVDIRLHPMIAFYILPGTDRLYSRSKWDEYNLPFPEQPAPGDIRPADIVTVGSGEDGSHILTPTTTVRPNGTFDTLEFNSTGELPRLRYGEGCVRHRPSTCTGYD
ncbi:MAG: hypothetical protein U5L04_02720, partial [Trueperaceae bacterium]|nr:hypothetical protein [Trueperaceae bacterium]